MKSYVWLSFGFMGLAYYELSGGGDFEPQHRVVAVEQTAPEPVASAETSTLLSLSTSNITDTVVELDVDPIDEITQTTTPEDEIAIAALAAALDASENALAAPDSSAAVVPEVVPVLVPIQSAVNNAGLDIREVAASRVNMRMGPSTDYDVITTLTGGTALEILEINADGWAKVSTVDRGIEGWISQEFLSAPQT